MRFVLGATRPGFFPGEKSFILGLLMMALLSGVLSAQPQLALPTENPHLFTGQPEKFYMYVNRNFRGVASTPWEGGQYGFVRTPRETSAGVVYSRFHGGIDIRPMRRDARGVPLDPVRAIAGGEVVHANTGAGRSNYGRYVVVRHVWDGSPYYSLYAHLGDVDVTPGQTVAQGDKLGRLGYTGVGLNRERAHLHLELNLMASENYEDWHRRYIPNSPNHHGIHNGLNLMPVDIAGFYLAQRKDPLLTLPGFLQKEPAFFKVRIQHSPNLHILKNYPWLAGEHAHRQPTSWEVSFNHSGTPLKMEPSDQSVSGPTLVGAEPSKFPYTFVTRGLLEGSGSNASLSDRGRRFMHLLSFPH